MDRAPLTCLATDRAGNVLPGAIVRVYNVDSNGELTDLAETYVTPAGSQVQDNPKQTDAEGGVTFWLCRGNFAWTATFRDVTTEPEFFSSTPAGDGSIDPDWLSPQAAVIGPPGPTGPAGPTGATGAPGPKGDTGAAGPAGADGAAGPKGDTGSAGPAGADGAAGPKGDKGDAGDIGPAGPKGDTGDVGPAGPAGADGAAGPAGAAGAVGPKGDTGAVGPAGADGAVGPAGAKGDTGAQGPAGPAGADGAVGPAGPTGAAGPAGADGAAGPQGLKGDTGAAGPQGATGPAGAQGVAGPTGPTGPTGATGPTGPTGPAGLNPRGVYSGVLAYATNDVVTYGGSSWRATAAIAAGSETPGSAVAYGTKNGTLQFLSGTSTGAVVPGGSFIGHSNKHVNINGVDVLTVDSNQAKADLWYIEGAPGSTVTVSLAGAGSNRVTAAWRADGTFQGNYNVNNQTITFPASGGLFIECQSLDGSNNSVDYTVTFSGSQLVTPAGGPKWAILAAQGATGATGPQGAVPAMAQLTKVFGATIAAGGRLATAIDGSGVSPNVAFSAKTLLAYRIECASKLRVRFYSTAAKRDADVGRPLGTDPTGDHGLQLEVVTGSSAVGGQAGIDLSPAVFLWNGDTPRADELYVTVDNLHASITTCAIYLSYQLLEA